MQTSLGQLGHPLYHAVGHNLLYLGLVWLKW